MCYEDYIPKASVSEMLPQNDDYLTKLWSDLESQDEWLIDNITEDDSTNTYVQSGPFSESKIKKQIHFFNESPAVSEF